MTYDGCRVQCGQCVHFKHEGTADESYGTCAMVTSAVKVSATNNVCRRFEARIKNPSSPPFDFDEYLEWLGTDYYRPYAADKTKIIGSARLGEVVADGGKLAELLPEIYSPFYETYDLPYCSVTMPRCHVKVGEHYFDIDYRLYRELAFINEDGEIIYVYHRWKDRPTQRKVNREIYGRYRLEGSDESSVQSE